jgi:hypothetical protein
MHILDVIFVGHVIMFICCIAIVVSALFGLVITIESMVADAILARKQRKYAKEQRERGNGLYIHPVSPVSRKKTSIFRFLRRHHQ